MNDSNTPHQHDLKPCGKHGDTPKDSGLYLGLFHGRSDVNENLNDWGADGPLFGPLRYVHTTYMSTVRAEAVTGECLELDVIADCVTHGGMFYGDLTCFYHDPAKPDLLSVGRQQREGDGKPVPIRNDDTLDALRDLINAVSDIEDKLAGEDRHDSSFWVAGSIPEEVWLTALGAIDETQMPDPTTIHNHICPYCGVGIYCDDINKRISPNTCDLDADYICATCEVLTMRDGQERILADNTALNARLADLNAIATKYQADLANANANYLKVDAEANRLAAKLSQATAGDDDASKNVDALVSLIYDLLKMRTISTFLSEHRPTLMDKIRTTLRDVEG